MYFDAFKPGVVSKRLLNETTWNKKRRRKRTNNIQKRFFEKLISQCGLSTKSLKPRGIYNTRENVISASREAFVPTNLPSRVATKNRLSIALHCQHQRTKQTLGQLQNLGLVAAENEFGSTTMNL
ncbi:hypothetical protein P3485_22700 [Vibrio parahaemolyticus]|nr:hypothetical protein [Vibrio parahaemolyticus]MDF4518581.1 hypothetical protein [Vibrio parahaemolyticus]MDF4523044.1 hypothetical protein [Vibrio parahaemolyticus]MDF4541071.1 hypothetical protein [Vibrio parahaemolyticus]MDF4550223.1 hypothetical protein [Vibrio parahaemolyticus]